MGIFIAIANCNATVFVVTTPDEALIRAASCLIPNTEINDNSFQLSRIYLGPQSTFVGALIYQTKLKFETRKKKLKKNGCKQTWPGVVMKTMWESSPQISFTLSLSLSFGITNTTFSLLQSVHTTYLRSHSLFFSCSFETIKRNNSSHKEFKG